jgi:hypothetical protein
MELLELDISNSDYYYDTYKNKQEDIEKHKIAINELMRNYSVIECRDCVIQKLKLGIPANMFQYISKSFFDTITQKSKKVIYTAFKSQFNTIEEYTNVIQSIQDKNIIVSPSVSLG